MKKSAINKLRNNKKVQYCYIRKGPYYRPNAAGYTDFSTKAGVYKKEDAIRHAEGCDDLTLVPINISEHNERIAKEVEDLMTRFIYQPLP